jgi:hypothetical protein
VLPEEAHVRFPGDEDIPQEATIQSAGIYRPFHSPRLREGNRWDLGMTSKKVYRLRSFDRLEQQVKHMDLAEKNY